MSILLPLNNKCSLQKTCKICHKLGYRNVNPNSTNVNDFYSNKTFVLPCSTLENEKSLNSFQKMKKSGRKLKHVLTFEYLKKVRPKNLPVDAEIGLIYQSIEELDNISPLYSNYFLLNDKLLDIMLFNNLDIQTLEKLQFFYVPEKQDNYHSIKEYFAFAEEMKKKSSQIRFSTPFDHDLIDRRNVDHMHWHLVPDTIQKSKNFDICDPKISIVIPFFDRSDFIKKILLNLNLQSMSPKDFEIILVDDGSSKKQKIALKKFLLDSQNLTYVYLHCERSNIDQKLKIGNRAGPARNVGAQLARSDILLFMDSDILLPSNYLDYIFEQHTTYDVILPRRIYLNELKSKDAEIRVEELTKDHFFQPYWNEYINDFYKRNDWKNEKFPWMFTITYSLSMKKVIFDKVLGFRTNYISFGYEDLDFGLRLTRFTNSLKFIDMNVFHLYHFNKGSEYTLDESDKATQLSFTAKTFLLQNTPLEAKFMLKMLAYPIKAGFLNNIWLLIVWKILRNLNRFKKYFVKSYITA